MLNFKQEHFFSFSDIEKRQKIYKKEYYNFLQEVNTLTRELATYIASVSSLLIDADRNMRVEDVTVLQNIFEKYIVFEKELSIYTSTSEKELSKTDFSVSVLLEAIRRFKLSVMELSATLPHF